MQVTAFFVVALLATVSAAPSTNAVDTNAAAASYGKSAPPAAPAQSVPMTPTFPSYGSVAPAAVSDVPTAPTGSYGSVTASPAAVSSSVAPVEATPCATPTPTPTPPCPVSGTGVTGTGDNSTMPVSNTTGHAPGGTTTGQYGGTSTSDSSSLVMSAGSLVMAAMLSMI